MECQKSRSPRAIKLNGELVEAHLNLAHGGKLIDHVALTVQ